MLQSLWVAVGTKHKRGSRASSRHEPLKSYARRRRDCILYEKVSCGRYPCSNQCMLVFSSASSDSIYTMVSIPTSFTEIGKHYNITVKFFWFDRLLRTNIWTAYFHGLSTEEMLISWGPRMSLKFLRVHGLIYAIFGGTLRARLQVNHQFRYEKLSRYSRLKQKVFISIPE